VRRIGGYRSGAGYYFEIDEYEDEGRTMILTMYA
jgi:hypothetical protein